MPRPGIPLTSVINVTATGNTTIIAASAGMPLAIWKLALAVDGATNVTFQDTNSSAKTGAFPLAINGSLTLPFDSMEWFRIDNGAGLVINQSGNAKIQGIIVYSRG